MQAGGLRYIAERHRQLRGAHPCVRGWRCRALLWQELRRHRACRLDFAPAEDAELLELSNLCGVASRVEASDFLRAAILVATRDKFFVEDCVAGKHHELVRIGRV